MRGLSVVAVIVMTAGVLGACRKSVRSVQPAKAVGAGGESGADSDAESHNVTIETGKKRVEILGSGAGWPQEMPAEVPEFTEGSIIGGNVTVTPEGRSWEVAVGQLQPAAMTNYESKLKAAGFQTSSMIMNAEAGESGSVTARKGNTSVVVISAKGTTTISVALKK